MPPSDEQTQAAMNVNILVSIARLEEQIKAVNSKLDDAVVSRAHFEERLAPLTENMNRWKGGMAAITLVAGSIGALVTTFVKQWFMGGPP